MREQQRKATMTQEKLEQPSMYCRQCGYALVGLSEDRCPECGRVFDAGDRRAFLRHPHSYQRRRWIKRIALALGTAVLLAVILVAASSAWIYWQYHADWQAEQQAIRALEASVTGTFAVVIQTERHGSALLDHLAAPWNYRRERVDSIGLFCTTPAEVDLAHLAAFKQCSIAILTNLGITDDQLRHLEAVAPLTTLMLAGNPAITDGGLVHLKALTALMYVDLDNTAVTDAGLEHLKGLPNLRGLSVRGTKVTSEGIQQLKQTMPSLKTYGP
jgi:hypothetical protein